MTDEELRMILRDHLSRYPKMQPQDVVKLLYQNEFGPGHLVSDQAACLKRLKEEYDSIQKDATVPLIEDIGNGFARINLCALDASVLSLEELADLFMKSADRVFGKRDQFEKTLAFLEANYEELSFVFSHEELTQYLSRYIEGGCPMVSHSETYRQSYHPAYRVVKTGLIPEAVTRNNGIVL